MPDAADSRARTRAFARVLGPYLAIMPAIVAARFHQASALISPFFANLALVWITGATLVFAGLFIIANHQIWRGAAAIMISAFGWILALRGLFLLLAPQAYERMAIASEGMAPLIRLLFGLVLLCGLWLTYDGWIARPPQTR